MKYQCEGSGNSVEQDRRPVRGWGWGAAVVGLGLKLWFGYLCVTSGCFVAFKLIRGECIKIDPPKSFTLQKAK